MRRYSMQLILVALGLLLLVRETVRALLRAGRAGRFPG